MIATWRVGDSEPFRLVAAARHLRRRLRLGRPQATASATDHLPDDLPALDILRKKGVAIKLQEEPK